MSSSSLLPGLITDPSSPNPRPKTCNKVQRIHPSCGSSYQQEVQARKCILMQMVATRSWIALIICLVLGVDFSVKVGANSINNQSRSTFKPLGGRFLVQTNRLATFNVVSVDQVLQQAAFSAILALQHGEKEYEQHNVTIPANLSGVTAVQALHLVRNSFLLRGINNFNEFHVPNATQIQARVRRLIFVYTNFGNFSSTIYQPPAGLEFLTPVLSLAVYDASNLTSTNPLQYTVNTSTTNYDNITVTFSSVSSFVVGSSSPLCATFSLLTGNVMNTVDLNTGNNGPYVCSFTHLGAFAIVGQVLPQIPSPAPSNPPASSSALSSSTSSSNTRKITLGTVFGVVGGLAILALLGILGYMFWQRRRINLMHLNSDQGETLEQSSVRHNRVPVAGSTRTRPSLENLHDPESDT